jgi:anaerobic magnesium-protoporphyrin IX monomethyl ester cyclase
MKILFLEIETASTWALAAPGPGHLAAFIRPRGHQAALLRVPHNQSADHILSGVRAERPDLLGLSLTTRQWPRALEVARQLKAHLDLPIIAGGLQATFASDQVLADGAFDLACIGEGEEALLELLDSLAAGGDPATTDIPNLRRRGAPPPVLRPPLPELDRLPFVARDLLDERYGVLHLSTQRGCPFPCTFCAAGSIRALYPDAGYLRRRSVENVLAEVRLLRASGPLNYLVFLDDTFSLHPRWIKAFCAAYGREFGIGFSINARAETVTPELLGQLADAGCRHVIYGVESGSPRVRREVLRRPLEDGAFVDAFRWTRDAGMLVTANYLLGLPGESAAEMAQTLALHQRLEPDDFGCFVFRPYPGTPLYDLCREQGLLPADPAQPVAEDRSLLRLPQGHLDEITAAYRRFAELREQLYRSRYSAGALR